jgi:hypothetical protein
MSSKRFNKRPILLGSASMLLAVAATAAEHKVLLPTPQSVQYGTGTLPIRGIGIRFASSPTSEDRFAAAELSRALMEKTGLDIPVWESDTHKPAIVLERTGGIDPLPLPGEQSGPDSREAYELEITPTGAQITGRSSAAVFYGVETLRQLIEGEESNSYLPETHIKDWPSLAYRGTLVDVASEGPMCTEDEIKRQLDFLAQWKANQYYFYSEASIALNGYPLLNPGARYSQDQIRRIVAYGRDRHIDVVPMVEMYGHLHDLFRIEKYSDLADFPQGGEFNPANPKVRSVLEDWATQISALFPSRFVNIGFDETWTLQQTAEKAGAGATPVHLFLQQLNTVAGLFQARGKQVLAYADIMVKFPGIVSQLPRDLIAVPWFYEPTPDPEYKKWLFPLVAQGIPNIVCSGVHSWNEIAPDYDTTFANIDTLLAAGRKAHTLGLLNTVWTDDRQALIRMSWPGMAYGAIAPWQNAPLSQSTFFEDYARVMYPESSDAEIGKALTALNEGEVSLQKILGQTTMLSMWQDPFSPSILKRTEAHLAELRQCRLLAEEAEEHLDRALPQPQNELRDFLVGARLLDYAGMKFLYAVEIQDIWSKLAKNPSRKQLEAAFAVGITNSDHSRVSDLMDAMGQVRALYRAAWQAQYTDYRLFSALELWNMEFEYWRNAQVRLEEFVRDFQTGETLPNLEDVLSGRYKARR